MSDLSSTSAQEALKRQRDLKPNVLLPVLWLAATFAIAWPSINVGIFNAMSTDDATRAAHRGDGRRRAGLVCPFPTSIESAWHVDALVARRRRPPGSANPVAEAADWNARRRSRDAISLAPAAVCSCARAGRGNCPANELRRR